MRGAMEPRIEPVTPSDRGWVEALLRDHWGAVEVVTRGRVHLPASLPGRIARAGNEAVGLITWRIEGEACEVVTLNSLRPDCGIGSRLIEAARAAARAAGCRRLWLITTNDNLHAIGFYQKRGFELAALHRGAIAESRRLI